MTSVREDLEEALRKYEEEERKRRQRELKEKEGEIKNKLKGRQEETIQSFYEHLKQPEIEGYSRTAYCDSEGKNTVGAGIRIPRYEAIKDLTMTSKKEPVSSSNPAWSEAQKKDFMQKLNTFCADKKNWKKLPEKQFENYNEKYDKKMPYFQDNELEELAKNYIRNTALPAAKKNLSNVGINFYKDLNKDGRNGFLDLQYNVGGNKFKLMDFENHNQIDRSNLKYKNELKENPMRYQEPTVKKDLIDNGIWPDLSEATKRRDTPNIWANAHRAKISEKRNRIIQDYLKNPWYNDEDDDWWY